MVCRVGVCMCLNSGRHHSWFHKLEIDKIQLHRMSSAFHDGKLLCALMMKNAKYLTLK